MILLPADDALNLSDASGVRLGTELTEPEMSLLAACEEGQKAGGFALLVQTMLLPANRHKLCEQLIFFFDKVLVMDENDTAQAEMFTSLAAHENELLCLVVTVGDVSANTSHPMH